MIIMGSVVLWLGIFSYAGLELTSSTRFCQSCHIMEYAYLSWAEAKHNEHVESCADCHIPGDFSEKVMYKAKSGTSDFYKNLVGFSGMIEIKDESKAIVIENCRGCHSEYLASGDHEGGKSPKDCIKCHRNTAHIKETIKKY